jgi:hypothetical protein
MQIGPKPTDMIEVIYSLAFGPAPHVPAVGAHMVACGDYITSNKDAKYPASPDGAVIHWIHRSKNPRSVRFFCHAIISTFMPTLSLENGVITS